MGRFRPQGVTGADRAAWQAWADARAQAAFRRARLLEDAGDPDGAWRWYERANRLAPDSPNVMFPLAVARLRGGDTAGSVRLLRELTRRFDFPEGWAALSGALLAAGEDATPSRRRSTACPATRTARLDALFWSVGLACLSAGRLMDCLVRMEDLRQDFGLREAAFLEAVCLARLQRMEDATIRMQAACPPFMRPRKPILWRNRSQFPQGCRDG